MFQSKQISVLKSKEGILWLYNENEISIEKNNRTKAQSLIHKFPLIHYGKEYSKLHVPCIPAYPIQISSKKWIKPSETDIPLGIKIPINKESSNEVFNGFASGRRSAIIEWKGKLIRLKGCGNDDEGFLFSKGVSQDPDSQEIRGSHYYHTAARELYLSKKIDTIMSEHGFNCGNIPLALFQYSESELLQMKIRNEFPKVDKCCAVFESYSDKRLFTHLIQGIDILCHHFVEFCMSVNNEKEVRKLEEYLTDERKKDLIQDPNNFENFATPCFIKEDVELGKYFFFDDKKALLDLNNTEGDVEFKEFFDFLMKSEGFLSILNDNNLPSQHREFNSKVLKEVSGNKLDNSKFYSVLSKLITRLGFEVGKVKKILLDNRINWGCYRDHHPYIQHNNAHPNNFIVLPSTFNNLLAPIDFDLAFEEHEFLSIDFDESDYGKYDQTKFEQLLRQELFYFEQSISGVENMVNFKYCQEGKIEIPKEILILESLLKVAVRDTLKSGVIDGFLSEGNPEIKEKSQIDAISGLCLIFTHQFSS